MREQEMKRRAERRQKIEGRSAPALRAPGIRVPGIRALTVPALATLTAAALVLGGCAGSGESAKEKGSTAVSTAAGTSSVSSAAVTASSAAAAQTLSVRGPYGRLTVQLPDGWTGEVLEQGSERLQELGSGAVCALCIRPAAQKMGWVEIGLQPSFGVCGTGLTQEKITLAGQEASVGTYEGERIWSFVSFGAEQGQARIVALTHETQDWSDAQGQEALQILDTVSLERGDTQGGVGIYGQESEDEALGVSLAVSQVSDRGITLSLSQYDSGEDIKVSAEPGYRLQVREDGRWVDVPELSAEEQTGEGVSTATEGENEAADAALSLSSREPVLWSTDWTARYGRLSAGTYRIGKELDGRSGTGESSGSRTLWAQFLLAGEPYT